MKYDVFISYSSHDQKVVEGLCGHLESRGIRCFVAYRDIPRGVVWADAIVEALDESRMMVVVFSENFNNSAQVNREIELASEDGKHILTYRLNDIAFRGAKKYYLKNLNWIDAFPNPEQTFGSVAEGVAKLLGLKLKKVVEAETPVVPTPKPTPAPKPIPTPTPAPKPTPTPTPKPKKPYPNYLWALALMPLVLIGLWLGLRPSGGNVGSDVVTDSVLVDSVVENAIPQQQAPIAQPVVATTNAETTKKNDTMQSGTKAASASPTSSSTNHSNAVKTTQPTIAQKKQQTAADVEVLAFPNGQTLDFGKLSIGSEWKTSVEFKNKSGKALCVTKIVSPCQCYRVNFSRAAVQDNEEGTIDITFIPSDHHGEKVFQRIQIYTSAVENAPTASLTVQGSIVAPQEEIVTTQNSAATSNANEERLAKMVAEGKGRDGIYQVGDYYNRNGKQGVVFEVSDGGRHGKIVSLNQAEEKLRWCSKDEYQREIGASDEENGINNQRKIQQISGWRDKFPAFAWCADQGEGWYLPAIEELKIFTLNDVVHDAVNRTIRAKGGTKLFDIGDCCGKGYWASTESDYKGDRGWKSRAWCVRTFNGDIYYGSKGSLGNYVRAVSAF